VASRGSSTARAVRANKTCDMSRHLHTFHSPSGRLPRLREEKKVTQHHNSGRASPSVLCTLLLNVFVFVCGRYEVGSPSVWLGRGVAVGLV